LLPDRVKQFKQVDFVRWRMLMLLGSVVQSSYTLMS
jgi:hypothetical protein